ncbi:MAG TPA: enoyl-CoA hydratase/isomerase family protein, partial [Azospirillaceae bacterium]|nr:enoyl-CoA hydratase/isomerase family protein [Azospirillaceae bacterium]
YPDVGGTWFLPRCPGKLGTYLALTGSRLKTADILYIGMATHVVPSDKLEALKAELSGVKTAADVKAVLDGFHQDPGPAPLAERRALIDGLFAHDTFPALWSALTHSPDPWAAEVAAALKHKSPSAVKTTFEQMKRGAALSYDACMKLEFRLSMNVTRGHDFYEGVRSVIVDKDNKPRWQPATLDAVTDDEVQGQFGPTPWGELEFE